jgi:hypothetical protein
MTGETLTSLPLYTSGTLTGTVLGSTFRFAISIPQSQSYTHLMLPREQYASPSDPSISSAFTAARLAFGITSVGGSSPQYPSTVYASANPAYGVA